MSNYIVKTPVEAVLLIDKDAESIGSINEMFPNTPHFFTDEGIIFATGASGMEEQLIPYGFYIIKVNHGISAMIKEMFDEVADLVDEDEDEETHS